MRDESGVPHIFGDSITDLARAQGYVHAQERFFQMDLRRHITAGRLAELVGPEGLDADKVVRTMGWRRVAEEELPTLKPQTRQVLQAYADGVNTYLSGRGPGDIAVEYTILGLHPADGGGRGVDLARQPHLVQGHGLGPAWQLRRRAGEGSTHRQVDPRPDQPDLPAVRLRRQAPDPLPGGVVGDHGRAARTVRGPVGAHVGRGRGRGFDGRRGRDEGRLASTAASRAYAVVDEAMRAVPAVLGRGEGLGSNSWVVSGERSSTGSPLLANDPHLAASPAGLWMQNSLHCRTVSAECPLRVSGFSFAGVPGVVIGHNADIAWGFSNLGPDVTDFYLERVIGDTYLRDGDWAESPAGRRSSASPEAPTSGSPCAAPCTDPCSPTWSRESATRAAARRPTSRATRRSRTPCRWPGPVWFRAAPPTPSWTSTSAGNFEEFREAARSFAVPAQNLVYADREGHIGYQTPGQVPVRRPALPRTSPGCWPAPGWDSAYDWQGYVEYTDLPWALDPDDGVVVTANQPVTRSASPFLTGDWDRGWRSARISERLAQLDTVSPADMAAIQTDTYDPFAAVLVPALLAVPLGTTESDPEAAELLEFTRGARDLLREWDFTTPTGDKEAGAAAAYYNAVWRNLTELLFDDELPVGLKADGGGRYRQAVEQLLADPRSAWWDNKLTPNITEGKDEVLRQALVGARLELTRELGKDPAQWQWGKLHRLTLEHPVLGGEEVPGPVRWLVNEGPFDMPGGSAIVNANSWNASEGYEVTAAPAMRMVVDLADLDASTWVNQTGVSGHPIDEHYGDQLDDWVAGRQRPWPFSEAAVRETDPQILTLRPEEGAATQ